MNANSSPKPGDTVYCTKYALTDGIRARILKRFGGIGNNWTDTWASGAYVYLEEGVSYGSQRVVGRDVFATRAEAVAAAEKQRAKKIASLRKQIEKLEGITFDDR